MEQLPKRTILSPATPGSRTPEEFRRAVELVLARRSGKKAAARKPVSKKVAAAKKPASKKTAVKKT